MLRSLCNFWSIPVIGGVLWCGNNLYNSDNFKATTALVSKKSGISLPQEFQIQKARLTLENISPQIENKARKIASQEEKLTLLEIDLAKIKTLPKSEINDKTISFLEQAKEKNTIAINLAKTSLQNIYAHREKLLAQLDAIEARQNLMKSYGDILNFGEDDPNFTDVVILLKDLESKVSIEEKTNLLVQSISENH